MANGYYELLELFKIDRQLVGLKKIRDAFPEDVARQQLRCDAAASAVAEIENSSHALESALAKDRLEVKNDEGEISQLSDKLRIVKNTKEYAIITERIKDLKEGIAAREEQMLAAMEELDRLKEALAEKRQEMEGEGAALAKLNADIETKTADIKAKQKSLVTARNQQIAKVEAAGPGFMPAYNAALQRGRGIAFAPLRGGVCGECRRKATANLITQVQAQASIDKCHCDGCGRLLYLDAAPDAADEDA